MIEHAFPVGWVNVSEETKGRTQFLTTTVGRRALGLIIEVTIKHPPRRPADPSICEMFLDSPGVYERHSVRTPTEAAKRRAAEQESRIKRWEEQSKS
jgi:hypothetical protein